MSFDTDPQDREQRFLLNHQESDCLFEVFSRAYMEHCTNEGCDDVTGDEFWEEKFKHIECEGKR